MSWREEASCKDEDTSFWFPHAPTPKGGAPNRTKMKRAVSICESCPVRRDCYETAIRDNEEGIWGGYWFRKTNRGKNQKVVTLA